MQEFVMLVGPSGCGKSTWAKSDSKNYNHQYVILSSDAIRGELWSDENDQQNPAKIFEILQRAEAEAQANQKLAESITDRLIEYRYYEVWDGKLPQMVMGESTTPMVQIP